MRNMGYSMMAMTLSASFIIVFLQTPAAGKEDELPAGLWSREQMVKVAGYGEEKLSKVVIGGRLLCHGGGDDGKLISHPYPVSGANVAVLCRMSERRNKPWARGSTNGYGEFLIDLPSHLHATPDLEKICSVRVFRIPRSSPCGRALGGKREMIELESAAEGVRVYSTGDIRLVPKPLDEQAKGREATKREMVVFLL